MTIYEVLSLNKELLKTLSEFSININDYKDVRRTFYDTTRVSRWC